MGGKINFVLLKLYHVDHDDIDDDENYENDDDDERMIKTYLFFLCAVNFDSSSSRLGWTARSMSWWKAATFMNRL